MPHLTLRHVDEALLKEKSARLADRLCEAIGCERSWITLDLERTVRVLDGAAVASPNPFVQVAWFPRPAETRARAAAIIAEELRGDAEYVTTVFLELDPAAYFEDGASFG